MVFDIVNLDRSGPVYAQRYNDYNAIFTDSWEHCGIRPVHIINTQGLSPGVVAGNLKATGKYDGAILRNPNSLYRVGLVKDGEVVKVKPVMSLDLLCIGFDEDEGEKTGRVVTTLYVKHKDVMSKVGSGVPHDLSGDKTIGKIVEIECMGITAEGKLREPRFKGVRFDKENPDA
jgi:DNA ligase-1